MNYKEYRKSYKSNKSAAESLGICEETFRTRALANKKITEYVKEYKEQNTKLKSSYQKQLDISRVERKNWRYATRLSNALLEIDSELLRAVKQHKIEFRTPNKVQRGESTGIIQLSDLHLNECVDIDFNKYNWEIASERIRKHILDSMIVFKSRNVNKVVIAMTGDMLNSDRRLDEVLCNATNRANALFLASELILKCIEELNYEGFDVSVTYVAGNESRIGEDIGITKLLASDNFDTMIFHLLRNMCNDVVKFHTPHNPLENVISINDFNILLIHGHLGMSKDITTSVAKYVSKYSNIDTKIDFVMFGHIHQALVSDKFARSGSTVGNNEYNINALNLHGKSSQNAYVIQDMEIYSFINPLDNTDGVEGYELNKDIYSYNNKSKSKIKSNIMKI
jgi:predicted phosphodiesterase